MQRFPLVEEVIRNPVHQSSREGWTTYTRNGLDEYDPDVEEQLCDDSKRDDDASARTKNYSRLDLA